MPDEECFRRITDMHGLETRVRLLEASQVSHDTTITKLEVDGHEMVTQIKLMTQSFIDFKNNLNSSLKFGFRIISTSIVIFVFIAGAFLKYSHDLDNKYAPKFDRLVSNTEAQRQASVENSAKINTVHSENIEQSQDMQDQIDTLTRLKADIAKMQKLKVIKGSK